jgi:hypothetical protein
MSPRDPSFVTVEQTLGQRSLLLSVGQHLSPRLIPASCARQAVSVLAWPQPDVQQDCSPGSTRTRTPGDAQASGLGRPQTKTNTRAISHRTRPRPACTRGATAAAKRLTELDRLRRKQAWLMRSVSNQSLAKLKPASLGSAAIHMLGSARSGCVGRGISELRRGLPSTGLCQSAHVVSAREKSRRAYDAVAVDT